MCRTHSSLKENSNGIHTFETARVKHITRGKVGAFYKIENLDVEWKQRCGGCKQSAVKCHHGGNNYILEDEQALLLIESKLEFDIKKKKWITEYPWIKDQVNLPDNKIVAYGKATCQ